MILITSMLKWNMQTHKLIRLFNECRKVNLNYMITKLDKTEIHGHDTHTLPPPVFNINTNLYLLNFLNEIIHLQFLALSIIIFGDINNQDVNLKLVSQV